MLDYYFINTDHIPFYHDMTRIYLVTKQGAGSKNKYDFRRQVSMDGSEKDQFTVQLSITKNGKI